MLPLVALPGVVAPSLFVPSVIAHQGGWDEILMVAVPVGLFAFLLYAANKRATRLAEQRGAMEADEPTTRQGGADDSATAPPSGTGNGPPPRPRGPI